MFGWFKRKAATVTGSTTFFQGNVRIEGFDYEVTRFRVIDGRALIEVPNSTHLRLVDDLASLPSLPHFEIIAPMTAVSVIEGEVPSQCLKVRPLTYYLDLRRKYVGE